MADPRTAQEGGYSIRAARVEEAGALSALAFRSKAHWGYSQAFMEACRAELTYSASDLGSIRLSFLVAESSSGDLVGFAAVEQLSETEFELEALFVEPEWIGKGAGRVLMAHAKTAATSKGGRRLEIQSDPHAQPFYEAAGGVVVDWRESGSIPGRLLPVLQVELD